jgi:uncharacterized protein YjaG (DUF416 family)
VAEVKMMLKFDEAKLVAELEQLSAPMRVVFAAACAERQMPAYKLFHSQTGQGDPDTLQHALDDVWQHPNMAVSEEQIEEVMALIPQEDGFAGLWTQRATNAQNAGMSVIYALRTRLCGEAQEAAWAARVAYEALDNVVINSEGIDTNNPDGEHRVLSHPLIQAELARQHWNLDELRCASASDLANVIERVRNRARAEAAIFFGSISESFSDG